MKNFNLLIQEQFNEMCATGKLFRSTVSGSTIWKTYLDSFTQEQNPVFRDPQSSTYNCNHCHNFIRRYGNIIALNEDGEIMTMFDVDPEEGYSQVSKNLSNLLKNSSIRTVFFETYSELNSLPYESCNKNQESFRLGIDKNLKRYTKEEAEKFGMVKPNEIKEFNHFHLNIPTSFVDKSGRSLEQITASFNDKQQVFLRAIKEIPLDVLLLVKDLINQGSLLDGTAHLYAVEQMAVYKKECDEIQERKDFNLNNWSWFITYIMEERIAKFKNTLIGVLCSEIAEGVELNKACENWNKRVDPANYMKAVAPITKKQIEEAEKFVQEEGYVESFNRRFATLDDIKISEIKHVNTGDGSIKNVSLFEDIKPTSSSKKPDFSKVESVSIEKFMKDILPGCTSIEAYLENKMESNLVCLTTAKESESKKIFKWDNNYSWTFNGNLAGKSQIKEAVKNAGGETEGVLNCRLAWNDENQGDCSDLDLWAKEPEGRQIGFSTHKGSFNKTPSTGMLDVDNTNPNGKIAVENITWFTKSKMKDGEYLFWVNQYRASKSKGFKIEIEFEGTTYEYTYDTPLKSKTNVKVATVVKKGNDFSIIHHLPEQRISSKQTWGLDTNEFHKVNLVCLSPNHWGNNKAGNLHYLFMLDGCKSDTSLRSFHNENLNTDLTKHRKVMEVLGAKRMLEPSSEQLCGLGFNSTVKEELIVKCEGSHKRMLKLQF